MQAAINAAGNLLPSDLPAPPIYAKVNPADAPIMTLALTSKTLPLTQVEDLAEYAAGAEDFASAGRRPGDASAAGNAPAVRVQVNPLALAAYGLNIDDLRTDDRQSQRQYAEGQFRRAGAEPTRSTPTTSSPSAAQYRDLVIAYQNGAPVHLTDVATVDHGAGERPSWAPGRTRTPAIILNIQRQPGANVIEVVDSDQGAAADS